MGSACTFPTLRWLQRVDPAGCSRLLCTPSSLVAGLGMRIFCVSRPLLVLKEIFTNSLNGERGFLASLVLEPRSRGDGDLLFGGKRF